MPEESLRGGGGARWQIWRKTASAALKRVNLDFSPDADMELSRDSCAALVVLWKEGGRDSRPRASSDRMSSPPQAASSPENTECVSDRADSAWCAGAVCRSDISFKPKRRRNPSASASDICREDSCRRRPSYTSDVEGLFSPECNALDRSVPDTLAVPSSDRSPS